MKLGPNRRAVVPELAVTDDMIDPTSVSGMPGDARRIEAYPRSGIDLPIITPFARGQGAKSRFELRSARARQPKQSSPRDTGNIEYGRAMRSAGHGEPNQ